MKTKHQFNLPLKIHSFGRHGSVVSLSDGSKWELSDATNRNISGLWRVGDDVFLWEGNQDIPTIMLINISRYNFVDGDALSVKLIR